jgi:protein gp37
MSANSKIEWTDHTFNPWIGCTKVSPGCAHCYAETRDKRHLIEPVDHWGKGAPRLLTSASNWRQPYRWNEEAKKAGKQAKVFCASLADVFDPEVPAEWRKALFDTITRTPYLIWQLLTKRPEIAHDFYHNEIGLRDDTIIEKFLPNVWLGVSVEDQKRADERIPLLLEIPAAVRFLSCEPLLGPVDIAKWLVPDECGCGGYDPAFRNCINWVIAGGESGPNARPMHPDWARSLRDQCVAAGGPFFFKQWGEWEAGTIFVHPGDHTSEGGQIMHRSGKKRTGRLLDGREWNEFPQLVTGHSSPVTSS